MKRSWSVLVVLCLAMLLSVSAFAAGRKNFPARMLPRASRGLPATVLHNIPVQPKTSSVWFTSNGAPTHASPQGQMLTWAANCLTTDTLQWELWIDSNKNGLFDSLGADQDLQLFVYSVANGDTLNQQGLPDTTAVTDNEIVNALKNGFAPSLYWMRAVSLVDGSSAFDSVRVTPMVSPWATVSGHVHVPGDSALQGNLWLEAGLYAGGDGGGTFWAALTDSFGNYTINIDNAYTDTLWDIGGLMDIFAASGAYVAPPDTTIRVNGGNYTGVNFAYTAATDSVTGDITLFGGGTPSFSIEAYAQWQGSGNYQKYTTVSNGHYQLFFAPSDSGTWRVGVWFDNAGYMKPNGENLTPVGAGHLIQNFVLYPANDSIKGRVTESGGAPTRQYQLNAWSNNSQFSNQVVSDAQGYYTLLVSSLASDYSRVVA